MASSSADAQQPRSAKLQEFHAHDETVNSVCVGETSCRVLATGSNDCTVNVWKLGRPAPLMTLTGLRTQVDCVRFDGKEEVLAGGSRGGAIKLWDLSTEKIQRSLQGHAARISALDFHPYGNFLASGSLDKSLRIWDIRKRGCLHTYKGHEKCITALQHSPDGRWVATGDGLGFVRIWDLTAGKLLQEFQNSSSAVTCLAYHPEDFVLAVGSSHRNVSFWDLESFERISQTTYESHRIRDVRFTHDGSALMAASQGVLRLWGWEPVHCFDSENVSWNALDCIALSSRNELVGVSHTKTLVSVHIVEVDRMHTKPQPVRRTPPPSAASSSMRRPAVADDAAAVERREARPVPVPARGTGGAGGGGEHNPQQWRERVRAKAAPAPVERTPPRAARREVPVEVFAPPRRQEDEQQQVQQQQQQQREEGEEEKGTTSSGRGGVNAKNNKENVLARSGLVEHKSNAPIGLDPSEFLPTPPRDDGPSDEEVRRLIMKDHHTMCGILTQRFSNIRVLKAFWERGDVRGALEALGKMSDISCAVDFLLSAEHQFKASLTLETFKEVLPVLNQLLDSKFERYVKCALRYLKSCVTQFAAIIVETRTSAQSTSAGLSLALEERLEKCNAIYATVHKDTLGKLKVVSAKSKTVGALAREVLEIVETRLR